jgi:hypothetical protein
MDTFLGMAFFICVGVVIFGLVKSFPWFIIKGALVNGPGFLAALYAIFYGARSNLRRDEFWRLVVLGDTRRLVRSHMRLQHVQFFQWARGKQRMDREEIMD